MPFEPFPSNLRMGICQRLGLWSKIKIQPTSIRIWIAGRESDNQNHSFSLYLYIYIYIDAGASCKGNIQPNLGRKARPWQGPVHPSHLIPMAAMAICGRGMPECQGTIWSISIRTILSPPAVAADANAKHPDIPRHHWTLDCNQLHSTKIAWYERGSILVPMHFHKVVGKRVDIHEKSHGENQILEPSLSASDSLKPSTSGDVLTNVRRDPQFTNEGAPKASAAHRQPAANGS